MNELKAAAWTAAFTFAATVAAALTGLLAAVENVVNGTDPTITDDLATFGKVVLSAAIAAGAFLVNFAYRWAQAKGAPLPGATPTYNDNNNTED